MYLWHLIYVLNFFPCESRLNVEFIYVYLIFDFAKLNMIFISMFGLVKSDGIKWMLSCILDIFLFVLHS